MSDFTDASSSVTSNSTATIPTRPLASRWDDHGPVVPRIPGPRGPVDLLAEARCVLTEAQAITARLTAIPATERAHLRAERRTLLATAARLYAAADGDSDPDADELLKRARRPRSGFPAQVCGECDGNWAPGHVCPPQYDRPSVQADAVLNRVTGRVAYLLRDRQIAEVAA